jgi:hypothetical protein
VTVVLVEVKELWKGWNDDSVMGRGYKLRGDFATYTGNRN